MFWFFFFFAFPADFLQEALWSGSPAWALPQCGRGPPGCAAPLGRGLPALCPPPVAPLSHGALPVAQKEGKGRPCGVDADSGQIVRPSLPGSSPGNPGCTVTSVVGRMVPLGASTPLSAPELSPHEKHNVEPSDTRAPQPRTSLPIEEKHHPDTDSPDGADGPPFNSGCPLLFKHRRTLFLPSLGFAVWVHGGIQKTLSGRGVCKTRKWFSSVTLKTPRF